MSPIREDLMRLAIEWSRKGFPAPNPHVGCVIELDGEVVGVGYHDHAGGPHAEVNALRESGDRARGATAYVTLEPCNHHGRTGPCSEALISAGVARVVVAVSDPNPKAAGGAARLREAGIEVVEGVLTQEAERANKRWLTAVRRGWPYVVGKAAASLDGRIALPSGESKWITGEESRRQAHVLRAECGAVLVGRRTVELDDPELTVRHIEVVNQPVRVVLDPQAKLAAHHRVFPAIHVTGEIRLPDLLKDLYARGLTSILVEGGAFTLGEFVKAGLVDRYELFLAPKLLGAGKPWLEADLGTELAHVPHLTYDRVELLGQDLWISAEPSA